MQNRTHVMMMTALAVGAVGLAAPASAQAVPQTGTYRLVEVAGRALPAMIEEEENGCTEEVLSGTLTLAAEGEWTLVTQERETCGDEVEEEEEDTAEGTYRLDGDRIRFEEDDAGDDAGDDADDDDAAAEDADDADDAAEIDLDDLATGSRTADGLTARLEDGETVLVFRR